MFDWHLDSLIKINVRYADTRMLRMFYNNATCKYPKRPHSYILIFFKRSLYRREKRTTSVYAGLAGCDDENKIKMALTFSLSGLQLSWVLTQVNGM